MMNKILSIVTIPFMLCITKKCGIFVRKKCLHFLQRESFYNILPRKVAQAQTRMAKFVTLRLEMTALKDSPAT